MAGQGYIWYVNLKQKKNVALKKLLIKKAKTQLKIIMMKELI